jgi:Na+/proline symporter
LIGLFLASLLAAIMSASGAQMMASSGLLTENIYKRHFAKNKSQRHYVWTGRIASLLIVLLAIVLQTMFEDVIQALEYLLDMPAILGVSLWLGIVWRGWTPAAVWVSTILGGLAWGACVFFPSPLREWGLSQSVYHADGEIFHAWRITIYLSATIASGVITSLFSERMREDKLDAFFLLIHTPVKPGEVVQSPCTLPKDPLPPRERLFNIKDLEITKPTWGGVGGFLVAWICVGLLVWLTSLLARIL